MISLIPNVEEDELAKAISGLFNKQISLQDFLYDHKFLTADQFLTKLFGRIPEAGSIFVMKHWIMENSSIASLNFDRNKEYMAFVFQELSIIENFQAFCFLSENLDDGFNIIGTIFNKKQHCVILTQVNNEWVLNKCSGIQKFKSWGDGCVACYEMGFVIKAAIYSKNWKIDRQSGNSLETERKMKEICDAYKVIPSTYDYLQASS